MNRWGCDWAACDLLDHYPVDVRASCSSLDSTEDTILKLLMGLSATVVDSANQ